MSETEHREIMDTAAPREPASWQLILALGIAGFAAGILLVSTYLFTDPLIRANKAEAVREAIYHVLPGCDSFTALILLDGRLEPEPGAGGSNEKREDVPRVFAGYDAGGALIGFAIPGSEPGFQDVIATIFGYDGSERVIIGFEVLESKETPGLGDKIFKDADFQMNFSSLAVMPEILPVKKGEKQQPNEVETITGATISSNAVVRSLNKSMDLWRSAIDRYIEESSSETAGIESTESIRHE